MLAFMFLLAGCKIGGGGGGGGTATSSARDLEPTTQIYDSVEPLGFTDEGANTFIPEESTPQTTVVPEPGTIALLSIGLAGFAIGLLKRKVNQPS